MKRAKWALAVAAWLAAGAAMPARAQKPADSAAKALVDKALLASDLEAKGAPAFRLEARIRVDLGGGQTEDGKLVLVWTPAGWRHREVTLGADHSVEVSGGKQTWTRSTMGYVTYPVFLAERAVNLGGWLRRAKGQELTAPEAFPQQAQACVTAPKAHDPITYCFDSFTGRLARVLDSRWNVAIRYLDYVPFGTRRFPRLMEVGRRAERPFIEIRVVQLAAVAQPDLRLFLPVKGAKRTPTEAACEKVEPAKAEKMTQPKYPPEAQRTGISGIVKLYAVIGTDGIARGMWPVNSSAPVLTGAAVRAISQWRYRPRTCPSSGAKFPQFQLITIVFSSP